MELLEAEAPPEYQQIAEKALHLNQLGLSNEAIARHIGFEHADTPLPRYPPPPQLRRSPLG